MDSSHKYSGKYVVIFQNGMRCKFIFKQLSMYIKSMYILYLLLQLAIAVGRADPYEPEFVKSFLNRPSLLANSSSLNHHSRNLVNIQHGKVTLSLYIDNWTPYLLKVNSKTIIVLVLRSLYTFSKFFLL